jgi:hypothetical protein
MNIENREEYFFLNEYNEKILNHKMILSLSSQIELYDLIPIFPEILEDGLGDRDLFREYLRLNMILMKNRYKNI